MRSLKISNERILKIIADLGYEKIPTNMYEKLGMFIVDLAKDHMQYKFEVDHLNPKDNKIMLSTTRTKIIKKIINSVTYVLKEDELIICIDKRVLHNLSLGKLIEASEYGSSSTKPYPLFRNFCVYAEKHLKAIITQFTIEGRIFDGKSIK